MTDQQRFSELWTDYLEGELSGSGVAELRDLIASDEGLLKQAADMYQTHRMLGLVVEELPARQDEFIRETLAQLPEKSDDFVSSVMSDLRQIEVAPNRRMGLQKSALLAAVAATLLAMVGVSLWPVANPPVVQNDEISGDEATANVEARFASLAHAKFFGELLPPINSALIRGRDYVLMSGLAEVRFPQGASAILEGPAVFRVLSDESLALDVGRCSVHAPPGAEGFRVETPVTRVVDRGTRFAVTVGETSETKVHVIEGAADIYRQGESRRSASTPTEQIDPTFETRLTSNQARAFTHVGKFSADSIPFDPGDYQRGLPDRVISYAATSDADGRAEDLISVTVQRGGRVLEVPVDELIPIEVVSFTGQPGHAHIAGYETLPQLRAETSSDHGLVTGVINPGGSLQPLTSDPVIDASANSSRSVTPGMAIRFASPVVNGPGPDVVFFDLQTFSNPPDGDAFHVSPLKFKTGLKSHTIRAYDLTLESPAALDLAGFYIHMFEQPPGSLELLQSGPCESRFAGMKFRGLVVGIDLSDLGYQDGDQIDGLFIQDASDDTHNVDPVFIGGLPEMK